MKTKSKIDLDGTYFIKSDKHNWILSKKIGDRLRDLYFYLDIKSLLEDYVNLRLRLSNSKSIEELLKIHQETITALNHALVPLNIKISKGDTNDK